MNLPKGPDTLCFDKDEFMKVRAGTPLAGAGPWVVCPPLRSGASRSARVPLAGTSLHSAVSLVASGLAGAAWRKHSCEIVHIELNGLKFWASGFELNVKVPVCYPTLLLCSAVRLSVPLLDRSLLTLIQCLGPKAQ